MFNRIVVLRGLVPAQKRNPMRISNSRLSLAALLFALVLVPSSGWGITKNCPQEPKQNVPISSGVTYFGANCTISTTGDVDSFQFNAAAGDTWSMDTGLGASPTTDLCMALYPPSGGTAIFSGCTNITFGVVAVATNQTLTIAGLYTIVLTEAANATITFGLSLERISPPPPDGVPLILSQNVTGNISTPTAQAPYTFFGTTTGTYEIAASLGTGATADLCFNVYQPNGTSALSAIPCTNLTFGVDSIQAKVTPAQNGTYVVMLYVATDDGTDPYNLEVSCFMGKCGSPPPSCVLTDALTYASGTLTMNFSIGTPVAATWNGWLTYQNTMQSLWSQSQPITEPPISVTKTQTLAKSGRVGVLSTLTTPTGGITCSSWVLVNTGTP
jgi:hypothetical protein